VGDFWRSRAALGACLLIVTACSGPALPSPPPVSPPAPVIESAAADWAYALRVLALGDLASADVYLEQAARAGPRTTSDRAQMYRDLAEVRLALGDRAGAAAAVRVSQDALSQLSLNARFTPSERRMSERTLEALLAAADDDLAVLTAACSSDESPPAVDACYLLGWTYEQHAQTAEARPAYQAYIDRAPAWSFLRRAAAMRQHAVVVLASGPG
jgi:tetratricopeptide (TPR) repeat protein